MSICSEFKKVISKRHPRFLTGVAFELILSFFILIFSSLLYSGYSIKIIQTHGSSVLKPWLGILCLIGAPSGFYLSWFIGTSFGRCTQLLVLRCLVFLIICIGSPLAMALYCSGDIIMVMIFCMFVKEIRNLKVRRFRSIAATFSVLSDAVILHALRDHLNWFNIVFMSLTLTIILFCIIEKVGFETTRTSQDDQSLASETEIKIVETFYNQFISVKNALDRMLVIEDSSFNDLSDGFPLISSRTVAKPTGSSRKSHIGKPTSTPQFFNESKPKHTVKPIGVFATPSSIQPQTISANGTANVKYQPPSGTDEIVENGLTRNINTRNNCITAMKEFEGKSLEQLRLEDYTANRKGSQSSLFGDSSKMKVQSQPQPSCIFGVTPTSTNEKSGFGEQSGIFGKPVGTTIESSKLGETVPAFGAQSHTFASSSFTNNFPSSSIFGTPSKSTTNLFGKPADTKIMFGSAKPANGATFGAGAFSFNSTPVFGSSSTATNQSKPSFSNKIVPVSTEDTFASSSVGNKALSKPNISDVFAQPATSVFSSGNSNYPAGLVDGVVISLLIFVFPSLLEFVGVDSLSIIQTIASDLDKSWLAILGFIGAPNGLYVSWFIGASIGRSAMLMFLRCSIFLIIFIGTPITLALYCFGDIIMSLTFCMFAKEIRNPKVRRFRRIAATCLVLSDLFILHALRDHLNWFKIAFIGMALPIYLLYSIERNGLINSSNPIGSHTSIKESELKIVETIYNTFISIKQSLESMLAIEDENQDEEVGIVIGIDLGSSSSCVSVCKDGHIEILKIGDDRTLPSYVAFTADGQCLIGDAAKDQLAANPENTIFNIKQLIGVNFHDPAIQSKLTSLPFKVIEKNNRIHVQVKTNQGDEEFAPEQITAMIIGRLKEIAETHLKEKVTHAAITVPGSFNNTQRQATIDAGSIAQLKVLRIINEPTAAAIGSNIDRKSGKKTVLVYKLGSGSFDVTLLSIEDVETKVIATDGNPHFGGDDFDQRLVEHFIELHLKNHGIDIRNDVKACQQLRINVERVKCLLSSHESWNIDIASKNYQLTRFKFEELNMDLFQSTMETVRNVLNDAKMDRNNVDEVLLTGGSTAIPKIQQLIRNFFEGKNIHYNLTKDSVSIGVGKQAGILSGEEDPKAVVVSEVCTLPLGTAVRCKFMSEIISRNTKIPAKNTKIYYTLEDNQTEVLVTVYEGSHKLVKDNHFLGEFRLAGIPPAPAGVQKIHVTFDLDMNGILKVTAKNNDSGSQECTVINYYRDRLCDEDIKKIKQTKR